MTLSATRLSIEPTARVEFGVGALTALPALVDAVGKRRAFVVTDPGIRTTGILDRVLGLLAAEGIEAGVFDGVAPNPTTAVLDSAAAAVRAFGDAAVVAVGGGSALDSAKGIALLATNPGVAADYDYRMAPPLDGLPVIAIPTTAGTGAETNGFGVVEDVDAHCKIYVGHGSVRPAACILDPELTVGLPPSATAATGIDALVHGIESLASRGATPLSVAYAQQAVTLVHRWLPVAVADGTDLEARANLLLGAHLAGQALTLSGLGLVHGIAHSMSNHFHTVHGVALAAVLPEVMEFSRESAGEAFAVAARAMGVDDAVSGAGAIATEVGARKPLRELGLTDDTVPSVARGAVEDVVTANAPRLPTQADVEDLLRSAL